MRKMKLSEFVSRIKEIHMDMHYNGLKPSVEELIEVSHPMALGLHLLTEQELEVMIDGINDGLDAVLHACLYFDDEEDEE